MLNKMLKICRWVWTLEKFPNVKVTVGEVSRWSKMSKSTARRRLDKAVELGLLHVEKEDYKTTGRAIYSLTKESIDWLESWEENGL